MKSPRRQRAFSITELLVAVALGLILTVGLITVFTASKQGYRVQESRSRMQESARFALDYLARAIRLADFWGSGTPGELQALTLTPFISVSGSPCGPDLQTGLFANLSEGIRGFDGSQPNRGGMTQNCVSTDWIASSDGLMVRYLEPDSVIATSATSATDTKSLITSSADELGATFVRVLSGSKGILFNPGAMDTAFAHPDFLEPAAGEARGRIYNYKYRAELYFLRTNPAGVPALYYSRNQSSGDNLNSIATATELVEGVEMMKFEYGLDTDNNGQVNDYRRASEVPNNQWDNVLSVRIGLIIRGNERDRFDDGDTYTLPGGFAYTAAAADRRFQRILVTREVHIRNRTTIR